MPGVMEEETSSGWSENEWRSGARPSQEARRSGIWACSRKSAIAGKRWNSDDRVHLKMTARTTGQSSRRATYWSLSSGAQATHQLSLVDPTRALLTQTQPISLT
jgi:hypothetical protein